MEQVTSWLKVAAFMTESAHMILQSQQLLQLLIFLIDQILIRFLEELLPCRAVSCFICRYDDPVVDTRYHYKSHL